MKQFDVKIKKYTPSAVAYTVRYLVLIGFAYVLVYPFIFMMVNAIKSPLDWFDPTVNWIPKGVSFDNFIVAFTHLDYWNSLKSTLVNGMVPAVISFFSCAVAGYGLARFNFKGKKLLTGIMILCILIPDTMIMIPSYNNFMHMDFLGILGVVNKLTGVDLRVSIIDTPLVFILPAIFGVGIKNGLFIYIYTQFFKGLPKELEEAAWIDGAGPWRTFLRIVLPSSGASTVTVLVFSVVWYWNDFYLAQLYLNKNQTLSVMLSNFTANLVLLTDMETTYNYTTATLLLTCCLLSVLPLLVFFLFMQRKFIQSIATSGIVG